MGRTIRQGRGTLNGVTCTCGHENRAVAKFCEQCGTSLGDRQQATIDSQQSTGDSRQSRVDSSPPRRTNLTTNNLTTSSLLPRHLAEKILNSRAAIEGERKQVTVLFADIQGSMAMAEQVDPEDWHRIMDRFFTLMTDGVHRFEGTVNQYTGDGIMALFGAPIAHEDHAQRACFAALHLQEALRRYGNELRVERGLPLAVRIGLNSGAVVVGKIGDDLRMEYTAQGHTVGLAARMQQIAEPGRTYLTGATGRLVGGYFTLEDLGASTIKGVSEPVEVFALAGVGEMRTRLDLSRRRGFSKFVGRAREMAVLEDALAQTFGATGQIVGVAAEAGTGKSRLCFEFLKRCRERGLTVYETHCRAHGRAMPLAPVLELYRGIFGIAPNEPDRTARDKIAGRMVLLDPSLMETLPLLFDFLGVPDPERPVPPMDPELRQRRIIDSLQRLTRARGPREPIVVLVEDLHWIDPASDVFLASLVDAVPAGRILLIVNLRPEYAGEHLQRSYYRQIPLAPLGAEAIEEILDDLLGSDASLVLLRERIRERTGGNPFFIEEVVRELIERGDLAGERGAHRLARPVDQVPLPATVQSVLAARIDRASDDAKALLQTAAAIGRTFGLDLLAAVTGKPPADLEATMARLTSDEFVYVEALYPQPQYAFKHALTRDVAYESMLSDRKKALHAALARALEARDEKKGDERAALIAHHYDQAGEALPAMRWHSRAAHWVGMADAREGVGHYLRVRELLKSVDETRESLRLGVEACCQAVAVGLRAGVSDLEIPALLADAKQWAARSGDPTNEIAVLTNEGSVAWYAGDAKRGSACLEEALATARASGSRRAISAVFPFWVPVHTLERPARVIEMFDEIGEIDVEVVAKTMGYLMHGLLPAFRVYCLTFVGRCAEAQAGLEPTIERARAGGDRIDLAMTLGLLAAPTALLGHPARALALGREAVRLADDVGTRLCLITAYSHLLVALFESTISVERAELEQTIARLEGLAFAPHRPSIALGRLLLERSHGTLEGALEEARRLHEQSTAVDLKLLTAWALVEQASVLIELKGQDARADAEHLLDRARADIEESGARIFLPRIHLVRAALLRALGDEAVRRRELQTARALYGEMGAEKLVERVDGLLAG